MPYVSGLMELVVVIALLSAFNANVYGTSRMAFSLARRNDGPAALAKLSKTGVPTTRCCCRCSSVSSACC